MLARRMEHIVQCAFIEEICGDSVTKGTEMGWEPLGSELSESVNLICELCL